MRFRAVNPSSSHKVVMISAGDSATASLALYTFPGFLRLMDVYLQVCTRNERKQNKESSFRPQIAVKLQRHSGHMTGCLRLSNWLVPSTSTSFRNGIKAFSDPLFSSELPWLLHGCCRFPLCSLNANQTLRFILPPNASFPCHSGG